MNGRLKILKAGAALGVFVGLLHLGWLAMVTLGFAQPLLDFALWLLFIKPVYQVESLEIGKAAMRVALVAGLGFVAGAVLAALYNTTLRLR